MQYVFTIMGMLLMQISSNEANKYPCLSDSYVFQEDDECR